MTKAIGLGTGIPFASFSGGFNPFAIGRPEFYFNPELGITLNGADISRWNDQSGNGVDFIQATAANQFEYTASDANFNGQPVVNCLADGELFMDAIAFAAELPQPNTIIIACKFFDTPSQRFLFDGVNAAKRHAFFHTGGNLAMYAGSTAIMDTADTNVNILAGIVNGASSDAWKNGTQITPASTPGAQALSQLKLGHNVSEASGTMKGQIGMFMGWAGIKTAAEINAISNGLAALYNKTWTDI